MNRPEDLRWQFGSFRLDGSQHLLFRGGEMVPLSRKATDILEVLVQRHGQLVEKEELMRLVWPDSFVEESNLAVHISQLRKVLGESSPDHRIETIPRRGYRFVGAVERHSAPEEQPTAPPLPEFAVASAVPPLPPGQHAAESAAAPAQFVSLRKLPKRALWAVVGALFLLAVGVSVLATLRHNRKPAETAQPAAQDVAVRESLLLGEVANNTGEPVFDTTLREAIAIELEQSPYVVLISEERLRQSLRNMGKPGGASLTPELSRELCQRNGGAALLEGWIARLDAQYVIGLRAVNCRTGDRIADLQTTAAGKEQVLKALGDISGQLRTRLGESLSTIQKFDTPIEEATTSSLEALQAYSIGRRTMIEKGEAASCVPFFQKAIRIDPGFAVAYAALGNAYANLNETGLAAANIRKAYELREHVSEHERLYIESHYYQFVTGDLVKASQTYEVWASTFPNDEAPRTNLAVIYSNLGKFDRSLELAREAVRVAEHDGQSYANLVDAYISLDKPEEASAVARQAIARNLDSSQLHLYLYDVAWLQRNPEAMQTQLTWASGEPGVEDAFLDDRAGDLAASGQLRQAREATARAVEAARRSEEPEAAAGYEINEALREALFGNQAEARSAAEAALALARDRDTRYGVALALAFAGEASRAQALTSALDKEFPNDTVVQYVYLPTIRGAMALRQNDPQSAIKALEPARSYDLGLAGGMMPVYVRGLAYLAAKDSANAIAEFQRILDHPGVVLNAPIGPLARLQLGRALRLQSDGARARSAYDAFLTQWKAADAEIPVFKEAQTECAQL